MHARYYASARRAHVGWLLIVVMVLLCRVGHGATYYVDSAAGKDSNAGTSRGAAWKTWGEFLAQCTAGRIVAGDIILFRPGRYRVADYTGAAAQAFQLTTGCVGTAEKPITIAGDPSYSAGTIEISGSTIGNVPNRASAWTPAQRCSVTGSTNPGVPCTADTSCGGSGTCDVVPGVYFSRYLGSYSSKFMSPGVAFQPGATPGADPVLFEILYAPETTPIQMPTWTAGHNQVWIYQEYGGYDATYCSAAKTPWSCCTGAGTQTGCDSSSRIYVQTASGVPPDQVSPQVEFPWNGVLQVGIGNPVSKWPSYLYFTNHLCAGGSTPHRACEGNGDCGGGGVCSDTGHRWSWRWSMQRVLTLQQSSHLRFADGEVAYTAATSASKNAAMLPTHRRSGSSFPRDNGGALYLILVCGGNPTICDHHEFRRLAVHGSADEPFHLSPVTTTTGSCGAVTDCTAPGLTALQCNAGSCVYYDEVHQGGHLLEDVQIYDSPMERPNGTPVYPGGAPYRWPPPGYASGWATNYPSHYDPLGGGGQTATGIITNAANTTLRRLYVHDIDGILVSFEDAGTGFPFGGVLEYSALDGSGRRGCGSGTPLPAAITGACTPSGGVPGQACNGFTNVENLRLGYGSPQTHLPGFTIRHDLFANIKGILARDDGNSLKTSVNGVRWENNTIDLEGEYLTYPQCQGDSITAGSGWANGSSNPFEFANNIILVNHATVHAVLNVTPALTSAGLVAIDYNLWGYRHERWQWGTTPTMDWGTWNVLSGQDVHSIFGVPRWGKRSGTWAPMRPRELLRVARRGWRPGFPWFLRSVPYGTGD